jgi:ABC-type Mn2+/Zn2+ transport system ATPase subunit
MQMSEIKKRVVNVEHTIHRAADVCEQDRSAPQQLKDVIDQLNQQSNQGKQIIQSSHDESMIRQYIEDLESLGDDAKRACESSKVSPELRTAVFQAHDELSNLKHQLH